MDPPSSTNLDEIWSSQDLLVLPSTPDLTAFTSSQLSTSSTSSTSSSHSKTSLSNLEGYYEFINNPSLDEWFENASEEYPAINKDEDDKNRHVDLHYTIINPISKRDVITAPMIRTQCQAIVDFDDNGNAIKCILGTQLCAPWCVYHLKSVGGLRIGPTSLTNPNGDYFDFDGLFACAPDSWREEWNTKMNTVEGATRTPAPMFFAGSLITRAPFETIDVLENFALYGTDVAPYDLDYRSAARLRSCLAFANDAQDPRINNSEFVVSQSGNMKCWGLIATKDIFDGDEIFVSYGASYFNDMNPKITKISIVRESNAADGTLNLGNDNPFQKSIQPVNADMIYGLEKQAQNPPKDITQEYGQLSEDEIAENIKKTSKDTVHIFNGNFNIQTLTDISRDRIIKGNGKFPIETFIIVDEKDIVHQLVWRPVINPLEIIDINPTNTIDGKLRTDKMLNMFYDTLREIFAPTKRTPGKKEYWLEVIPPLKINYTDQSNSINIKSSDFKISTKINQFNF